MKIDPPLQQAQFLKRYKRFLADIRLASGEIKTIHCPNTGSMRACMAPETPCWYSVSASKTRKYPETWELATTPDGYLAGINTHRSNALVAELLAQKAVPSLVAYESVRAEVKYGTENSRIDFLLQAKALPDCYLEVKNVTLHEGEGAGFFPDAVSTRGAKHLRELMLMVAQGHRAVLLFCVQHSGITRVSPADHIDPAYGTLLREAAASGVEILAYGARLSAQDISLTHALPVQL